MKGNRTISSKFGNATDRRNNDNSMPQRVDTLSSVAKLPTIGDDISSNALLDALLPKLRPFQREAFEFATLGKIHRRQSPQGSDATASTSVTVPTAGPMNFIPDPNLLGKGRILLADEMGLGKTITSLAIMAYYRQEWPLLILCPASLRYTWPAEIEKFIPSLSPKSVYVVSGYDDADFYDNPVKRRDIQIVVATYSLLQKRSAAACVLEQYQFKCVVADESHNLKQKNSQRCQYALPLLQAAKRLVLLSGTPALARPVELWTQVYSLAPDLFGPYNVYTQRYCNAKRGRFGWDVNGISNAQELHLKLQQVMVRRLKSEVLHELPAKQRSIVPISIDRENVKACKEIMEALRQARLDDNKFSDYLGANGGEDYEQGRSAHLEARRLLMQAYQIGGAGKANTIAEYLLDWLAGSSGSQKVLVFAHHKAVLDVVEMAVSKVYKGVAHIRIDGQVAPQERAQRVRKFQTNPQVRVALLSITAAGVGLTLTAASTVMMAELHWTPGVLAQAEDRCHRLGQTNAVQVLYLVCKDPNLSVDMQLLQMIARKVGNLGQVIDGSKASFQAQDVESKCLPSVQDEISDFFANEASSKQFQSKAAPVKGTILSFFQKAGAAKINDQDAPSSSGKKQSTLRTKMASSATSISHSRPSQPASKIRKTSIPPSFSGEAAVVDECVTWTCEMCTFDNSEVRRASGWLACAVCSTPHLPFFHEEQREVLTVTPGNDRAKLASLADDDISDDDPLQADVIAIDDDSISDHGNDVKAVKFASQNESEIIVINDDEDDQHTTVSSWNDLSDKKGGKEAVVAPSFLSFSVSENSGRIMIHFAVNGESANINFTMEDVLLQQAAERLQETKVKRSSKRGSDAPLLTTNDFDNLMLAQVIRKLDRSRLANSNRGIAVLCEEVKQFVVAYDSLREVEKKAMMKSGAALVGFRLHQAVAKLMITPSASYSNERFTGGAKERAKERLLAGSATDVDRAVLGGDACAWCARPLLSASKAIHVVSTYCSRECTENGRLCRGGMYGSKNIRDQVFALEGGVCCKCGIDAHALFLRMCSLHPSERLNALCNNNWKLPKSASALERLLQQPREGDFWQADHIQAVAEGGGGCGLENLRTLCTPCHQEETERLRARLRLNGSSAVDSDRKLQTDIRDVFGCRPSHKRPRLTFDLDKVN